MKYRILLLAIMSVGNVNAQQTKTEPNDSIQELDQVFISTKVIFGSKYEAENRSGSSYYLSPQELEKFGYTDITRVLRTVPGVSIYEEDGFGLRPNISLRGTSPERSAKISVMEDGVLIAPAPYSAPAAYYFPSIARMQAVEILKGNQDVDGKNTLLTIEEDIKENAARIIEIEEDIAQREAAIAAGGMKKGAINFNQNKIDTLKQELKQIEEDQRNLPQWLESARNFEYGNDFGGSDETVLTRLFDCPIMVYDWPHEIKAFYMKRNPDDPRFARGVDVLAPEGYGEIVGGGERETSEEWLVEKINEHKLPMDVFQWYLDLRRYGSVPHSGFGLGLERLVAWICKLDHVRETIPFPRYYGRLEP